MQIQTDDPDQIGQLISIDGKIAGRMNDFVRVTEGTHTIELFVSPGSVIGYRRLSVDVSTERFAIRNVYTPLEVCSENKRFKVESTNPLIDTVTTQDLPRITFFRPNLVPMEPTLCNTGSGGSDASGGAAAAAGASGFSIAGFWNWFDHTSLKVMFSSDPDGAEILVDGKGVGQTNAELEFPYRRSAPKTLSVVVRKSGYINCDWSIELTGESATNTAFRCPLVPIRP